jgi:hypothetical protein
LLLLFQFGRQRAAAGDGFWMALEEPELHVPPPLSASTSSPDSGIVDSDLCINTLAISGGDCGSAVSHHPAQ